MGGGGGERPVRVERAAGDLTEAALDGLEPCLSAAECDRSRRGRSAKERGIGRIQNATPIDAAQPAARKVAEQPFHLRAL